MSIGALHAPGRPSPAQPRPALGSLLGPTVTLRLRHSGISGGGDLFRGEGPIACAKTQGKGQRLSAGSDLGAGVDIKEPN